jgi:hypothetical protein
LTARGCAADAGHGRSTALDKAVVSTRAEITPPGRSGRAGRDCCSSTEPAVSGGWLDPRLTAPSDQQRASAFARSEPVPLLHPWKASSAALTARIHATGQHCAALARRGGPLLVLAHCDSGALDLGPPGECARHRHRAYARGWSGRAARRSCWSSGMGVLDAKVACPRGCVEQERRRGGSVSLARRFSVPGGSGR